MFSKKNAEEFGLDKLKTTLFDKIVNSSRINIPQNDEAHILCISN